MTDERLAQANQAVREQWEKYDRAVAAGTTGAPLVQIDRKLTRLELERDNLRDELANRGSVSS